MAWVTLAAAGAGAGLTTPQAAVELSLTVSRLEAPGLSLAPVRLRLVEGTPATLHVEIGELVARGQRIRNLRAKCADFSWTPERIECRRGTANLGTEVPLSFTYVFARKALTLELHPAAKEDWTLRANFDDRDPWIRLRVDHGELRHLANWLPSDWPKITGGRINGEITVEGRNQDRVRASLTLREAAFSDATGSHAAENLGAEFQVSARRNKAAWSYRAEVSWKAGEAYWQPVYLKASDQRVIATGSVDENSIFVEKGEIRLGAVGEIRATGQWNRNRNELIRADLESGALDVSRLYSDILRPFLFGTALADLRAEGTTEIAARWRAGNLESVNVELQGVSFEDASRRFAVFGAKGRIPWHRNEETVVDLEMKGGELLRVPFGPVRLPVSMRGMRFRLDNVALPILDGTLTMRAFATEPPKEAAINCIP